MWMRTIIIFRFLGRAAPCPPRPPLPPLMRAIPLTVNFTAGSLNNGTFSKYQASTTSDFSSGVFESTTEGDTSIDITGLTNGTAYTVYLRTVNSVGDGVADAMARTHLPKRPMRRPSAA